LIGGEITARRPRISHIYVKLSINNYEIVKTFKELNEMASKWTRMENRIIYCNKFVENNLRVEEK